MKQRQQLTALLDQIQAEMQRLDLWGEVPPPPEAFTSELPFCVDTLEFHDWLRWVFVPRMRALLDAGAPLPARCALAPMAEEMFKDRPQHVVRLVAYLRAFDVAVTRSI
ncbi:MAG TPA: YqcC family protein [Candidatus Competibacteraceae bacterium]|nr:YqcC family protein [Candidatus Competibacteraceae bacterium]